MILITGPLYSGKKVVAMELLGCDAAELERRAVWDVQDLGAKSGDLPALAEELGTDITRIRIKSITKL